MKRLTIAVLITSLLAGCSAPVVKSTRETVKQNEAIAMNAIEGLKRGAAHEAESLIENVDGPWVALERVDEKSERSSQLDRQFTISKSFKSFSAAADYIGSKIGMPIAIADDVQGASAGDKNGTSGGDQKSSSNQSDSKATAQASRGITLEIDGTVRSVLDELAFRNSVSWELDGRGIRFFKYQTKSFELVALPGDSNGNNVVSSSGSQSSSSGGGSSAINGSSAQSSGITYKLLIWPAVERNVKNMLTPAGKVSTTPEFGTILVTDTPKVLAEVGRYMDALNAQLSKQVLINVRVLAVQLDAADQYGINWTAVYSSLGKAGFSLTNANTIVTSGASVQGVLSVPAGAPGNLANWVGSSAMVQALSTQGDVSQVTSLSMPTLNNQPAPLLVGNQQSYLASSSATPGSVGVQPTVTLTPGQLNTGFSLTIVPHILENDKILLQYGTDISSLVSMGSYTSGLSSIQTPNVNTRSFLQRVKVVSGETLVLTGFEQTNTGANAQGIGSADFLGAGGGFSKNKSRTVIVVLLQPILLK